ncbi:Multidrug efflux permease [Conexivisphaera calida]|uniref:Multidrug efflux permease n=1 Tax=Conexivisphaera calida TaxID=1874277 RepID=A0A4P2VGC6_9ARCH|nr:Multidrug efflux permease [Conexivisphaera calida]
MLRTFAISLVTPYVGLVMYSRGMPIGEVGAYYLALGAASALGQLLGGAASDRIGRRRVMVLGLLLSGAALAAMGLSLRLPGYWPFASTTAVENLLGGISFSALNTMVGDRGNGIRDMVRNYGTVRIGINLGWALGPLVGGALADLLGYGAAFLISGAAVAASSLFALTVEPSGIQGGSGIPDRSYFARISPFVLLYAFIAQFGLTLTVFESAVRGLSLAGIGSLYTINGLMVVALQYPITSRESRGGVLRWLYIGVLFYAVGFYMLSLGSSLWWSMLSVAVLTVGEDFTSPIVSAVANALADPAKRGSYLGAFGMITGLSRSIGAFYGGIAMSEFLRDPLALWGSIDALGAASAISAAFVLAPALRRLRT